MRIFDYMISSKEDKYAWLESFHITSGLRYFGGKSVIGKYLMNHICNMAARMYHNGEKPDIFIDAFTGGGKLGLSIPEGWFDTIVMNDLNYGVYSYFKSCKENPTALVRMIEEIGEIYNEDLFRFFALNRSNGNQPEADLAYYKAKEIIEQNDNDRKVNFYNSNLEFASDVRLNELVAGAMTFWVTQTTWDGDTEPSTATYRYKIADNKDKGSEASLLSTVEKAKIADAVKFAQKHIFEVHRLMKRKNIIVENLDYRELIKKYNGLEYMDIGGMYFEDYREVLSEHYDRLKTLREDGTFELGLDSEEYWNIIEDYVKLLADNNIKDIVEKAATEGLEKLLEVIDSLLSRIEELLSNEDEQKRVYRIVMKDHLHQESSYEKREKLWYFDPPYHPATLAGGLEAPYEDTFTIDLTREMTEVLHNGYVITEEELQAEPDEEKREQKRNLAKQAEELRAVYGELKHFIKSDYDPKWCYEQEVEKLEAMKAKAGTPTGEAKTNIKKSEERVAELLNAYQDFDVLEENIVDSESYKPDKSKQQYIKIEVGEFDKGGFVKDGEDNVVKTKGKEFIWCRG